MTISGVVTALLALCALIANCTLVLVLWRAERRARVEPIDPMRLADEIERWLRELI
jgi:hypothetical protein